MGSVARGKEHPSTPSPIADRLPALLTNILTHFHCDAVLRDFFGRRTLGECAADDQGEERRKDAGTLDAADRNSKHKKKSVDSLTQDLCCAQDPFQNAEEGSLSRSEITKVVEERVPEIKACADKGSERGELFMKFVIHSDGSVSKTTITTEKFMNTAVGKCAEAIVKTFEFRKPKMQERTITYPFEIGSASHTTDKKPKASEQREREDGADESAKQSKDAQPTANEADAGGSKEPRRKSNKRPRLDEEICCGTGTKDSGF